MTLDKNETSEKMRTVKTTCIEAPFGEKRAAAMKHYFDAEASHTAKNASETDKFLEAAIQALA